MIAGTEGLRPPWTLIAIAAALAIVLGFEWTGLAAGALAPAAAPLPQAPADAAAAGAQGFAPPPIAHYAEIAARPLFVPDRKPQDEGPLRQAPAPPPPTLAVQGVVMSGDRHFAVIAHGNPPKYDSFGEGDTVDGWRVESIALDHVVLGAGGATVEVPVAKFDPARRR